MNIITGMKKTKGKKIFVLLAIVALFSGVGGYAQTYEELIASFVENQNSIETFIGMGSLSIDITMGDKSIQQIQSEMTMYMKRPDWFKMLLNINGQQAVTVQKGDLITQKIPGMESVMTQQADISSNLANRFFFNNFENDYSNVNLLEEASYESDGKVYRKFKIEYPEAREDDLFPIDYVVLHFDEQGLYVKSEIVSDSITIISTEITYQMKDGIHLFKTIDVSSVLNGMTIENSIVYSSVSVNTRILDKVFEVK